MRARYLTIAALVVSGVLAPVAATAATAAGHGKPAVAHTKIVKHSKPVKHTKPVKHVKPVKFAAAGTVSAVDGDARTITVAVKGGTAGVRGTTTTFSVAATARVTVDDSPGTLADVQAGDKVAVQGDKVGAVYTAARVNASTPEPEPQPEPSTSTEPSDVS